MNIRHLIPLILITFAITSLNLKNLDFANNTKSAAFFALAIIIYIVNRIFFKKIKK